MKLVDIDETGVGTSRSHVYGLLATTHMMYHRLKQLRKNDVPPPQLIQIIFSEEDADPYEEMVKLLRDSPAIALVELSGIDRGKVLQMPDESELEDVDDIEEYQYANGLENIFISYYQDSNMGDPLDPVSNTIAAVGLHCLYHLNENGEGVISARDIQVAADITRYHKFNRKS